MNAIPLDLLRLSLAALAVWRITHLVVFEDGPWNLIAKLRRAAGQGFWGSLMDCFYCSSVWVAGVFTLWLSPPWREGIVVWLGLSGAACLLERLGSDPVVVRDIKDNEE